MATSSHPNGGLKSAVEQHLLLRGSRNLETIEAYETFLFSPSLQPSW